MAATQQQQDAFGGLAAYLNEIGLGTLFTLNSAGQPGGWLWQQIVKGVDTADELGIAMEGTPEFKARYSVITEMRQRSAAGEPVRVPTVKDVRNYEDTVTKVMRQAGMPSWFYDHYSDAQNLMKKGLSPEEVETRVASGWTLVRDADPAVRQAFTDFYGVAQGDAALAAFVLDPDATLSSIEKASRAAYTAGYGKTMGIDVSKAYAERIAALPKTEAGIIQDLGTVGGLSPVLTEGYTETKDLTDSTGIDAVMFGDGQANEDIQKRMIERQSNSRSSTGGAVITEAGLTGTRSS